LISYHKKTLVAQLLLGYTQLVQSLRKETMMDIYCKHCGEPWDMYELHDMLDENDKTLSFKAASKLFAALGCGAFDGRGKACTHAMVDPDAAAWAEAAQELSEYPDEWMM
jgi:hypothetical protein